VAGDGTSCHYRVVPGTLFLVGTPIGNLGDLAPRAVETLAAVDLIAAEDTRRTGRLLRHLDLVDRPLLSFFEGNERERTQEVLRRLRDGATVALVTDGGMPTVSDPGFRLVRACAAEGIDVRVVPGRRRRSPRSRSRACPRTDSCSRGSCPGRRGSAARA